MSDTIDKTAEQKRPSGRFVLRIDPALHASLREEARETGVSLNELCAGRLALPSTPLPTGILEAVRRAVDLLGNGVQGVVAFGSWARHEMADGSDIDLLIVLGSEIRIDRSLYRAWDRSPLEWNGHSVEPHFVHLPATGGRVTGLWAEVALDGILLFVRNLSLPRRLAEIRRRIASGNLIRRWKGTHPYWVEVA